MKLIDTMNGSEWVMWVVAGIFVLLTIVFLSGHGSGLIAGYNTATEEEKVVLFLSKIRIFSSYDFMSICNNTALF